MIVLDAIVLIGFMHDQDQRHQAAVTLLRNAAGEPFGVSPLTLAEAMVGPARLGRLPAAEQMLQDIGVAEVPFPPRAAAKLAQLRATSGLKMPDCCVLLAAQSTQASLATFDQRLAGAAIARGITVVAA